MIYVMGYCAYLNYYNFLRVMSIQLILKTTGRCNFACDFCSASKVSQTDMDINYAVSLAEKYKPKCVSFEGGDPLCVSPDWYYEFIERTKHLNIKNYSFSSNLWDFYKRPEKWVDLFKRSDVDISTSFQYGNKRKLSEKIIFTENLFREVIAQYMTLTNKPCPGFISVIDYDNEHMWQKTIELAKELNTICKLNDANVAGKQQTAYPYYKIFSIYASIIENNLAEYEANSANILGIINNESSLSCPYIKNCFDKFISVTPNGITSSCSIAITHPKFIKFFKNKHLALQTAFQSAEMPCLISHKCLYCSAYFWCHSCKIKAFEASTKDDAYKQAHCNTMKESLKRILNAKDTYKYSQQCRFS